MWIEGLICWCHRRSNGSFSQAICMALKALTPEARTRVARDCNWLPSHCLCPKAGSTTLKYIVTHICLSCSQNMSLFKDPKALFQSIQMLNYHQHALVCLISSLVTLCWNLSLYLLILGTYRAVYSHLYDGPFHTGWLPLDLSSVFSRLNDFILSVFPHRWYCL